MTLEQFFEKCELPVNLTYEGVPIEIYKKEDQWILSLSQKGSFPMSLSSDCLVPILLRVHFYKMLHSNYSDLSEDRITKLEKEVEELKQKGAKNE